MDNSFQKLINWVEEIRQLNRSSASALVVLKENQMIVEHYSGTHSNVEGAPPVTATSQFNVASARKSYLGLAVAYALYEGKIKSLDDTAAVYFPEFDEALLGKTTIRHLVTHSHGLAERNEGTVYREFEPGTGWAYQNINVVMMAKLIQKLYHKTFPELLQDRVYNPLGFSETAWQTKDNERLIKVVDDPKQEAMSAVGQSRDGTESNLYVSAREFAYWGNLHLNQGYINGKQIVTREVIELAIQRHSPEWADQELPHHGLFWYVQSTPARQSELGERVPKGSYQILGVTGPTLLVIPEYNVVVAKMYNKRYNYGGDQYLHYLREFSNLVADVFSK